MAIEITVPVMGDKPTELYFGEWLVAVGDHVTTDTPVALIEADKAQVEVLSPANGRVVALNAEPKDSLKVGQIIAVLEST